MTFTTERARQVLAQHFRTTRGMLGISQPTYARLFEVERTLVQELEEGRLPAVLDQRLLKFTLLTLSFSAQPQEFLMALFQEIMRFYGINHIFDQPSPLIALYEHVLGTELTKWPWIIDSVRFRCRAIERNRLGSLLLLWAGNPNIHQALVKAIATQTPIFINFIDNRALLIIPSIYLYLNLDTSSSSNPTIKKLEAKLQKREPIGIVLPKEYPSSTQVLEAMGLENMRIFAYSQDAGILKEAEYRRAD